jgi:erythromycin esterase
MDNYKHNQYVENYYNNDYKEIISISPIDTNYADLEFLKEIVASKKIVILGEQQHGDGSSYLIKTRLIQFLHEECGFNSLIMETGMFDTYLLAENIENKQSNISFSTALYPFWSETTESVFLKKYLLNSKNLKIYGMDIKPTGNDKEFREQKIRDIIKTVDIALFDKYSLLFSVLPKIQYLRYPKTNILSNEQRDTLLMQIECIIRDLSEIHEPDIPQTQLKLFFSNLHSHLYSSWYLSENRQINIRDSLMAQNFFFLANMNQENEKIIIWTANSHGIYNDFFLQDHYKRFGSYLKETYRDSLYVISITSYKGYSGMLYKNDSTIINESTYKSCEKLMRNLNKKYLFYDFNNSEELKNYSFVLKCLGHNNVNSYWAQMTDGLIFIDNMKPIHYDNH